VSPTSSPQCAFGYRGVSGRIAVIATLPGENEILGVGWLLHQPSPAFDVVSTAESDRELVIVIAFHILKSM
jgi:hypothetical protein